MFAGDQRRGRADLEPVHFACIGVVDRTLLPLHPASVHLHPECPESKIFGYTGTFDSERNISENTMFRCTFEIIVDRLDDRECAALVNGEVHIVMVDLLSKKSAYPPCHKKECKEYFFHRSILGIFLAAAASLSSSSK